MSDAGQPQLISPPVFHAHDDVDQWVAAVVADTIAALRHDLDRRGQARLLVSGGSTPAPVYRALAKHPLDWAKVEVALVDERWLPAGDPDSNAHLIQETLLTERAAAAHFQAMITSNRNLDEAVRAANEAATPASVVLLGMGPDGHTASLFPHMRGLADALACAADYVEVDAGGCSGAGPWSRRISLTPAGLAKAAVRLLLIRGEHKRVVVRRALEGTDPAELPIRTAFSLPGAPLQIHWCP